MFFIESLFSTGEEYIRDLDKDSVNVCDVVMAYEGELSVDEARKEKYRRDSIFDFDQSTNSYVSQ